MKKKELNESHKIIIIGIILFIIVLSIISTTSNLLKRDAEQTHENIVNIYNKTFAEHLNNSIYNIDLFTISLKLMYSKNSDDEKINEYLSKYLKENSYIRSINILNEKIISKSTNILNLGLEVNTENYSPKPLFNNDILRFGSSYNGRDFYEAKKVDSSNEYSYSKGFFIPISKIINTNDKKFTVLMALNAEEFLNKYSNTVKDKSGYIEILNLNAEVLISDDINMKIGKKILDEEVISTLKEKNSYLGIKAINSTNKNIISVENIENYPISLLLRFDYENSLRNWEEKRLDFLFIITVLLIFIIVLILTFVIKADNNRQKEILYHKLQIKNQKRFELLFEQSNLFFFILDEDGKINKINDSAIEFFGKELENTYIWDVYCFDDEDKAWLKDTIIDYNENKKIEKEINATNLNLERKNLELTINSITIDDKKELVIFGKDITEKKFHERELRQAYQVFQNTHDGILVTDENVNIINVNNAFVNTTGYKLKEVLNKNPSIIKSDKNSKEFYKEMWIELKANDYWDGEIINRRKDGTDYTEWLTISAVYNERKALINYIGIFSDISKLKHQEEVIKEKERMLFNQSKMASMGEMLGNIAHQWRQPLSVISVAAGAIKLNNEYKNIYKEDEIISFIDSISNSTKYLSETIDDFRNFFMQETTYKKFDCLSVIEETLKLLTSNFKYKQIEVILNKNQNNTIFASENEFKQVLMNILNNAKDALSLKETDENKYIFIDIYFDEKDIYIEILDTAGGIEESILEKIFEPYFTTKHKSIGTGIGLYMAEEIIIKHMEGKITASNKKRIYNNIEYKGACFTLKIPLCKG